MCMVKMELFIIHSYQCNYLINFKFYIIVWSVLNDRWMNAIEFHKACINTFRVQWIFEDAPIYLFYNLVQHYVWLLISFFNFKILIANYCLRFSNDINFIVGLNGKIRFRNEFEKVDIFVFVCFRNLTSILDLINGNERANR